MEHDMFFLRQTKTSLKALSNKLCKGVYKKTVIIHSWRRTKINTSYIVYIESYNTI